MILKYIVQLPTYFYEIIVIFVNPFCTVIFIFFIFQLTEYVIYFVHIDKSFSNKEL